MPVSRVLIAALAGICTAFMFEFGGRLEGRIDPVMGALQVVPVAQTADGYTILRGEALKRRNCNFVELRWFLGPRGGRRVEVSTYFTDAPEVREAGQLYWDGIAVQLRPDEVLDNSHADVIHHCPLRPWNTRTRFYTSTGQAHAMRPTVPSPTSN